MNELIKVALLILGFLLGISSQVIIQIITERRKKAAVRDLMRVELEAFIEACEAAGKRRNWDSFSVETTCRYITEGYSRDRERFIAALEPSTRRAVYGFFLEVNGLLFLIDEHRKQTKKDTDGSTGAIGPGTYEGIAERAKAVLEGLK